MKCIDLKKSESNDDEALDSLGWSYQVCNEMVMPIASNGKTDMFLSELWNPDTYVKECIASRSGLKPQFDWAMDTFGGRNLNKDFSLISNIVFTNGDLDPWRAGGVLYNFINDKVTVKVLKGAAHHLELREPNPADPQDVIDVRETIITLLKQWI